MRNNKVKWTLISVSSFMAVMFLMPILLGILNYGTLAGLLLSALPISVWALFPLRKKNMILKIIFWIFVLVIALGIIYALFLSSKMASANMNKPHENGTVVVLGCLLKNNEPSDMLEKRLDTAAEYLNNNKTVCCVVSGGKGDDENMSEAAAMKIYLIKKGIDEKRIYTEDKSLNTKDNIKNSISLIKSEKLNENLIIITDIYHTYRASTYAHGYNVSCIGANTTWYVLPVYWVREWVALTRDILFK